ncbi:MAG: lipid-A-disaccharide synthase [Candidatus Omnitrophica bacterium]|nr:lipid-A-disaccharide synthase [Candidatus Omnitrophota bacterium]
MAEKQILIICGEPSGELHAARLVEELKKLNPGIKISATGSQLLHNAGAEIFYDISGLSVMGFFDVFKKLPKFFSLKRQILSKIKSDKPDAVILIDFSGFNLRLAKGIDNTVATIYYVSPQVWASRSGRVKTIKKYIKRMIVLFKFERAFYKDYGIEADWVGHPLLDIVKPTMQKEELLKSLQLKENKITITLLPGSRKQEVNRILPIMLKSAKIINESLDIQLLVGKSSQVQWDTYNTLINSSGLDVKIVEGKAYDCMNIADFCMVCSGTATLETAIMQKPYCLIYKMSYLNYLLYRPQIKLPYIGLANIVAGKKIIQEFIQFQASPKKIAEYVVNTLRNPVRLQDLREGLTKIKPALGETGAAKSAAKIILSLLSH